MGPRALILLSCILPCLSTSIIYSHDQGAEVCDVTGGHLGIPSNGAPMWNPLGGAMVSPGNGTMLLADSRNHVLRSVEPGSPTVPASATIVAGVQGDRSLRDGDMGSSALSMPYSVSIPAGEPYPTYALVADYGNMCIRNLSTMEPYTLTTVVCGGLITSPSDVAITPDGSVIYIADPMSHTVLVYDGSSLSIAAGGANVSGFHDGAATSEALFNQPLGIVLHPSTGNLYIADWLNDAIRVLHTINGTVSTLVSGSGMVDGHVSVALIRGPKSVRLVGDNILGVSDSDNGAIRLINLVSMETSTLIGNGTRSHSHGQLPIGTASAVWGITGSIAGDPVGAVFTEADTGTLRRVGTGSCTSITPPDAAPQCDDAPDISTLIDARSYLFTTGDSAFLSLDGGSFVTSRLPPSISGPTRAIVSMPHQDVVDSSNPPITRPSYTPGPGPSLPWNVTMHLKTVDVYMDTCRIQAKYSIYPLNSDVGSGIVLSVSIEDGGSASITCSVGVCTSTLSQCRSLAGDFGSVGWTTSSRSGSAQILVDGGSMSSAPGGITFHMCPSGGAATSGGAEGIYVDSPRGALIPGVDQYVMRVYVDSGAYPLFQWGIAMDYNTSLLSFQSLVTTGTFNSPLVTSSSGRVSANTVAKSTSPQGSSILIATVTFTISASMGSGVHPDAVSGIECLFLVNPSSNQFVTSSPARVFDSVGVRGDGSSSLEVSPAPVVIGILGISTAPYVITRPDGGYHGTSITAVSVRTVYNSADLPVASPQCTADDVGVLSIPGGDCSDIRPSSPSIASSSPASVVWVSDNGVAPFPVDIRAFVPQSVRLVVEGIVDGMVPMQMVRTRVMVRWSGDPGGLSDEVDVSRTPYDVTVVSSSPSHVDPSFMGGGFIMAYNATTTSVNLTLSTSVGAYAGSSPVEVSVSTPSTKGLAYITYYRSITWDTPGSPTPTFNGGPPLSQEGDTHTVVGVSSEHGTLVRSPGLVSSHPSTYYLPPASIANENGDGYGWSASIPLNAMVAPCVNISGQSDHWNLTSRDLVLPIVSVVSLEMCCSYARDLSPSGDALLYAGHSVGSYSGLYVTARMSDGTSKVVTNDARMSVQVVQNTCGAVVSWAGVVSSVAQKGVLSLRANFRGVASNIVHLRSIITVGVQPSISLLGGGTMSPANTIRRVNCATGVYQSIRVTASLITSMEGLIVPISNQWMYHSSSNDFVLRHSYQGQFYSWEGFSGASAGQAMVFSSIAVQPSVPPGNATLTVVDTSALLQSVQASAFPSDTLLGPYNKESKIGGGTTIGNIFNGGWPDYTPGQLIPSLITIGSNAPLEIDTSNDRGTAILLGNSPQPVTISAGATLTTTCDGRDIASGGVQSSVPVSGNIDMIEDGDVDIGRTTGVPVPPISGALSGDVEVRIRSPTWALKAFDLVVLFDPQRVNVHSCSVGAQWSGSFACTVNNAEGYAQIIGADVNSNLKGNSLRVAVLVLSRVSTGVVRLSGVRIKVSTSGYTNHPCSSTSGPHAPPGDPPNEVPPIFGVDGSCPFVAGGDVPVLVGSPTRAIKIMDEWGDDMRRNVGLPSFLLHGMDTGKRRRVLLDITTPPDGTSFGDCNADGVFDITDYLFAQEFYNGATQLGCPSKGGVGCQDRGTLSAWQDAQLHPVADPAAPTGGRDLFYLFNTYADKLRFVVDIDFRTSFDYLHLGVRLVGRTGLPPSPTNTRVLFAIMTSQRELFNGAYDEATGLVLVYAEARENGWFILDTHDVQPTEPSFPTSFDAVDGGVSNRYLEDELNVGIAFSVETADGQINWDLDPSRKSPFFGIHAGSYASGFTSFAPYAIVNLTSSDLCTSFFPWMSTFGPPAGGNGTDVNSTEGNSTEGNTTTTPPPPPMATLVGTPDPLLDGVYQSVVSVVAVGINHTSVDLVNPIHTHQTWIMHPITCFLGVNRTQVSLHSLELIPMGQEEVEALGGGGNLTSLGYNESEVGIITSTQGGMVALVTVLVDVGEGFVGDHPTEAARMNERLREGMTPPRSGEFSRAATVGLGERGTGADLLGGVGGAALAVVDSGVWRRFYQPPPPPTFSGGGSITWGASGEVWVWGVCLGLAMWFINPLRIE